VQNDSELAISCIVLAGSLLLLCYWFRYICLLILAAESPRDRSEEVARANDLFFPEVRSRLLKDDGVDLETLHKCLERDFAIITYLLERTPRRVFDSGFENAMLRTHFRLMSVCFKLTRGRFRECASDSLEEMLCVVDYFANLMGERSSAWAR
jgi:hypothetical protein